MKITVIWDATTCSAVDIHSCIRGSPWLNLHFPDTELSSLVNVAVFIFKIL
jgi:hypothetical protein